MWNHAKTAFINQQFKRWQGLGASAVIHDRNLNWCDKMGNRTGEVAKSFKIPITYPKTTEMRC